jgi:hypothetical protein
VHPLSAVRGHSFAVAANRDAEIIVESIEAGGASLGRNASSKRVPAKRAPDTLRAHLSAARHLLLAACASITSSPLLVHKTEVPPRDDRS